MLWEGAIVIIGASPRTAFVRDVRTFEPPREQANDRAVELPDTALLCARHDFEEVALDKDLQRRAVGVVHGGTSSNGQVTAMAHAELFWTADQNSRAAKRGISMGVL